MFLHQNVWFPDGEKHFPEWMDKNGEIVDGKGTYQIKKWRACLPHIKQFRMAVDVGAHVGLWSTQMLKVFQQVHAFEPVKAFRECFEANIGQMDGAARGLPVLYAYALGATLDTRGTLAEGPRPHVKMRTPRLGMGIDSGGTHVDAEEPDEFDTDVVELRALDEFDFQDVDFLKIDCEGYEHHVIEGAKETLMRCRPCVIVEQKARCLKDNYGLSGTPAVDMLVAMGAKVRGELSGDYIVSWD